MIKCDKTGYFKSAKLLQKTTIFKPGFDSFSFWLGAASMIPGLTFNLDKTPFDWWKLDSPVIYPQLHFASRLAVKYNSMYLVSQEAVLFNGAKPDTKEPGCSVIECLNDSPKSGSYGYIGRPLDLGLFERIDCAQNTLAILGKEEKIYDVVTPLLIWFADVSISVHKVNRDLSVSLIRNLLNHKLFWENDMFLSKILYQLVVKRQALTLSVTLQDVLQKSTSLKLEDKPTEIKINEYKPEKDIESRNKKQIVF
ncbi:hypothetical protein AY600_01040 [Phormidium willei BDU 130791]|nr:hypothetical protein AY600_01040 [Phormidium willei BDU 130791]